MNNKHNIHVIVPLGLNPFFVERGYDKVTELDWGQSLTVKGVHIEAEPSVHDSARSTSDQNETLWASWVIKSQQNRVLFYRRYRFFKNYF